MLHTLRNLPLAAGPLRSAATPTPRPPRARRGFTLLESALATVIIAVGVLALIDAQTVMSRANNWSTQAATATYLANELRERMRTLPRHDAVTGLIATTGPSGAVTVEGWGPEENEVNAGDYDDIDDFAGRVFGLGGTNAGPIDANSRIITEVDEAGNVLTSEEGVAVAMQGWSQAVTVEKVEPSNFSVVRAVNYSRSATGGTPALAVDQFPLRVTVTVNYMGPLDAEPREMARIVWIVP